ncbi:alpha-2A adrenergic receptor [Sphaeramia orbicularis]|uniref:alpha-2A adrenergic receptor n=1 Tax=Sphaeramia orbicularis TaxID=375764 RepID=UPI001180B8B5|nr:alpha-2A adrenergic receptor-like [Sphaeramia orbicularis]
MAAAPDTPCLSEIGGLQTKNISTISGTRPCNQSTVRTSSYSPPATAAFAISITFMMIVTIVGNILVIIAVLTSRSLKGAQNLFLVSLAAADILVATLIIPFSLANELQGYWAFSTIWCEIYLALDVLFCTSSIVHLCAIALDRYLSISRPVSYAAIRTPLRIKAAIIVVWLISAVISFPPLLTLDKSEGGEEVCELNSETWYILYSTIGSFFAPCVIMILVYVRIYQIAKQHTRCPPGEKHKKVAGNVSVPKSEPAGKLAEQSQQNGDQGDINASQREKVLTKTPGSDSTPSSLQKCPENTENQDTQQYLNSSVAPVQKSISSTSIPQCDSQILSAVLHKDTQKEPDKGRVAQTDALPDNTSSFGSEAELEMCEEGVTGEDSKDEEDARKADERMLASSQRKGFKVQVLNLACRYKNTMATSSGTKLVSEETPKIQGTPISRRKAMVNREKRFTFVLAVVMGVFVICWFPFFLSYSLQAVCPDTCSIPKPLFKFFFWIGYCNSCLNPVIYTIFNKDFRRAFKRILCRDTKGTFF